MKKKIYTIFSKIKKHKYIFSFAMIYLYTCIDNRTYNKIIPNSLRLRNFQKELSERFNFSGKLKYDYFLNNPTLTKPNFELNKVYPTNIFDTQKIFELATDYNIPIIHDLSSNLTDSQNFIQENTNNYLNFQHLKINFSNFNKILKFDKNSNLITVEPGVKIKDILEYLKQYDLTISEFEIYQFSNLTISDILYNNYFSFLKGKFIDEKIEEITVVVPNKQEALRLKQSNDFILSCANLKNIFLRSNSIFGLINEIKLKTEKIKEYSYLTFEDSNNSFQDSINFFKELEELKKNSLVKDLILFKSGDLFNIFIKLKHKKVEKVLKLFDSENLKIKTITSNEYLKCKNTNFGLENFEEKIFRKLKIKIEKNIILEVLKKINKICSEMKADISYNFNTTNDCIDIIVYSEDDLSSMENSIFLIQRIQTLVEKNSGNLFSNFFIF